MARLRGSMAASEESSKATLKIATDWIHSLEKERDELQASLLKAEQENELLKLQNGQIKDSHDHWMNKALEQKQRVNELALQMIEDGNKISELEETISGLHKANFGLEKSRVGLGAKVEDQKNQMEAILKENQKIKLDSMEESKRLIDEKEAILKGLREVSEIRTESFVSDTYDMRKKIKRLLNEHK